MRISSAILGLFALSGCINEIDVPVDMGASADAALAADMTTSPDAAADVDASVTPDASVTADAATSPDAATTPDASVPVDAAPDASPDASANPLLGDACGDDTTAVTAIGERVVTGVIDDFTHDADTSFRCNYTGPDAFFEFVAGDAGFYTFEVGGDFDVALRIFESTCGGTPAECADEEGGVDAESVEVRADAGESFFVFIDSLAPSSPTGSFYVNVTYEELP